jgi:hypothetical protein
VSALKPVVHASVVGQGRMTSDPAALDCTTQCDVPLAPGLVTFRAVPVPGWHFVRWTGLCTGQGNISSCNHMVSADVSVGAEFALDPVLTVGHAGTGSGTVSSVDAGFTCASSCTQSVRQDGVFRLVAAAGAGSTFSGWSGACSGTGECTITASANASVTATFTRNAGSPSGGGGGKGGGGALGLESLALLCAALAGLSRRARRSPWAVS